MRYSEEETRQVVQAAQLARMSVVVPARGDLARLERCLGALVAQDFDRRAYEILVVTDGECDSVCDVVDRWALGTRGAPRIHLVAPTRPGGPAAARNAGWRRAQAPIVAFTEDDAVPHPDWLAEGWKAMSRGAAAASGRVIGRAPALEFAAANCFVRRDALQAIGGFDERFSGAWRDDADLQFTLLEADGTVARAEDAWVKLPAPPAPGWRDAVGQQRRMFFDALLARKHPQLYRQRIRRAPPWSYYASVAAFLAMLAGLAAGSSWLALAGLGAWLAATASVLAGRLHAPGEHPWHDALLASIVIPFAAVCWRLAGAWRHRVLFL